MHRRPRMIHWRHSKSRAPVSMFTRLYLQFFVTLLVVMGLAGLSVFLLADARLQHYAETRLTATADLMRDAWSDLRDEEKSNWLILTSGLTGAVWQMADTIPMPDTMVLEHAHLHNTRAHVRIQLDERTQVTAEIKDWASLEQGYGWLFLDAISREASERREARFIALRSQAPWDIDRVTLESADLPPLALRQLSTGQSVRTELDDPNSTALFLPAGQGRAIRFGPIAPYSYLTVAQWLTIIALSLALLSLSFFFWVKPLDQRFRHLYAAVDQISSTRDSVHLPTDTADELGRLARHVERMALNLINQVEQNQQLNQAVSHDLKTPLARIRFSLELLDIDPDNPYRRDINRDIDRLVQLTDELLLYHQLQAPAKQVDYCDLVPFVHERLAAQDDKLTLTTDLPTHTVNARILPAHWLRLLDNLLGNAAQYGRGRIHVRLSGSDDGVRLAVEDNGPGLTQAEFKQLCEPFQRLETHRNLNQNNHGLGLALVSATAQHYEGRFHYQTSSLGGAAMIVDLPATVL